jgi:hypothetical protein
MAPVELMKLFQVGNALNTGYNQIKNPVLTDEDITLEPGKLPELTLGMNDIPKFNFEEMTGITSQDPANMQLAKVFNTKEDLIGLGAAKDSFFDTLTPKGEALEKFRKNATSMNNPTGTFQEYKGLGAESQLDTLIGKGNKNATENEAVIRDALEKGFLENESDFINQKPLEKAFADGGRVGLFMGGPALEGPALGIYNSMKAYNSFTDQEIANAIKEAGYELPTSSTPPDSSTPSVGDNLGITNNDRSVALPIGSVTGSGLVGDYMAATQDRQNRLTNPNKVQSFINNFTGGGQADIGEMIRTGQVDTRKTSGIPLGIGSLLSQILPDKYYDMSLGDQVFTQSQMGYTGPTVFGENPTGNYKDPFGLNVRSAFGNYAEAVGKNFDQLRGTLTKDREGVTFNEETGLFEGVNADAVNKQTEMIRNKYNFRKQQLGVKNVLDSKIKAADTQREKDYAAALEKARLERIAKQQIADAEKAARQRAQEEAIARDIARDMQESNRAGKTGGYQAGYDRDFMDGPSGGGGNTGGSPGSSGPGGSDSMGSFARGGLAAMFKKKR